MIGRSHKEVTIPMIFGSYKTTYPLYGQIEMIATRAAYCEASTLSSLVNELKGLTKVSEFDEFGMLKKVDIHECGNSILSNTYEYKKRSNNSKYISKQIKTEKIKVGSETYTRSYESDALGNITKITDSTFGSHSYEYDSRGFLIKADDETYSYDKNGNIVKKGDYTLTYDSNIKDRLVSFNGTKIEYDSSNPLNPRKYGSNTYQFEGRRLVRWLYGGGYYDYVYNDEGLRIKKTDYRGVTWDYIYDGNKLIREKSINNTLDFLYDEYDNLYGFIKDNSEKYLYIRDQLQNIIGITDISGKIVVKYSYDAWGALKNIEDTSSSGIGKLNPFRFKGYYYDNESSMYYCKTRYYVPQWGRWLSADSIEYLNTNSINGLNLYCYCFNNPIIYVDSSGYFPVAIDAITTLVDGLMFLYEFGLKCSLRSLKNAPKITMEIAKKMTRKGGHIQSARQIIRNQQKIINSTQQSLDNVIKFGKKMGKVMLVADIAWSLGENILSGEESWFTDTLVDVGVNLAIYGLSLLPGGFFIALAATVATTIWEDKIEKFKDDVNERWSDFWNFSWI